ncbi:synaptogyrin-2a [Triplophysa rosa]|uniref:Synaptogyrin n=1 Tax=Triplophysa rosa TaxID=992332 RepID=A0A9W7TWH4_TRIRA|nr:synaptogyrin-2a [Triplophysa rosa]KAI7804096.1 putative synaptogyrin-2-like [Triplophysa rosa]
MESSVYGSPLSGGVFDFSSFIKQPQTLTRLFSWIFSIVVFATIISEGYINESSGDNTHCIYNQNDSACSYGVSVGVLAFLACVVFIVLDALFPQISNANDRRFIVLSDLIFSGVWTFLWFVCFCVLTNQWSRTETTEVIPADAARAVVAFSFFSIATWALLTAFAFKRYRQGLESVVSGYTDPVNDHTSPYPSGYPPEGYQQSPFSHTSAGEGTYQPPAY